jgi:HSP20 family molecular chaperone IbpA
LIPDINDIFDDFGEALAAAMRALSEDNFVRVRKVRVNGPVKITTNVTARLGLMEALEQDRQSQRSPPQEPIIDVMKDERGLRVIALLPGIRKEDVRVLRFKGGLRIEVAKDGVVHSRDFACDVDPEEIKLKSVNLNNSVVEIRFSRNRKGLPG